MIEEIRAHPGEVVNDVDADLVEDGSRPDARELQKLRRTDGAGAEDDLTACECDVLARGVTSSRTVGNPGRAAVLDEDARDEGAGDHREVGTSAGRAEVTVVHAEPAAAPLRHGDEADTVRLPVVEVGRERDADRLCCVRERLGEHVSIRDVGERKARPTPGEQRLDVLPRPARTSGRRPAVVVRPVAAEHHHRVHGRRPAEHAAPREHDLPPVELGLGRGRVAPLDVRAVELRERRRNRDLELPGLRAGLDEQHGDVLALGQPRREHAARRPRADDDDVVHGPRIGRDTP